MKKQTDLEKQLAALPPCPKKAYKWTLEQDAAILKYAESKGYAAIGRVMGVNGFNVRRRHEFLKSQLGK